MCLHVFIRYLGVYDEPGIHVNFEYELSLIDNLKYGFLSGMLIGFFLSLVEYVFEKYLAYRIPMWLYFIFETIAYFIVLAFVLIIAFFFFNKENNTNYFTKEYLRLDNKVYWAYLIYALYISIGLSFIRISTEFLGGNTFWKILQGKYQTPKEETRIFMFLDLKSSTTIAEKLGHFKHSKLIKDCFFDLNEILLNFKGEIYQYVGDEAVITWIYTLGIQNNNCTELFFSFRDRLKNRSPYYLKNYGIIPEFKAGIHGGKIITVEVGTIKKEIAYHGDTINTAARIQSKCSEYQQQVIISKELFEALNKDNSYKTIDLGSILLRGKEVQLNLLGLKKYHNKK